MNATPKSTLGREMRLYGSFIANNTELWSWMRRSGLTARDFVARHKDEIEAVMKKNGFPIPKNPFDKP